MAPAKLIPSEFNLIDNIDKINNPQARLLAKNILNEQLMSVRNHARNAEKLIKNNQFFDVEGIVRKDISYLFNYVDNNKTTPFDLVSVGLGEVQDLLTSKLSDNIFTKKDDATINNVLSQIKVKDAVANLIKRYTNTGTLSHNLKMLSSFRKNVLDILDFRYSPGEQGDTSIEHHPYKDYTTISDFFVDFIYDPVRAEELLNKKESLYTEEDKKFADKLSNSNAYVSELARNTETKEAVSATIDYEKLFAALNADPRFNNLSGSSNILAAANLLSSAEGTQFFQVPNDVLGIKEEGTYELAIQGITRIKISEWLFKKAQEEISKTKDNIEGTNYLDAKKKDIESTTNAFVETITSCLLYTSDAADE